MTSNDTVAIIIKTVVAVILVVQLVSFIRTRRRARLADARMVARRIHGRQEALPSAPLSRLGAPG